MLNISALRFRNNNANCFLMSKEYPKSCRKPPRLRAGGTIAVTAPASPIKDREKLARGLAYLESCGYRLVLGESLYAAEGYLAGSDAARADELSRFFANPDIEAIFCARGGYGTMRLLDLLDWDTIAGNPKIFVGFSDITALHWALYVRAGIPSISGPMVGVDFADPDATQLSLFWSLLTEPTTGCTLWQGSPNDQLSPGCTEGILFAGTLTLAAALCGTAFRPSAETAYVLLLEDIGEEPYRIDRMLCQLLLTDVLPSAAGIAFGEFAEDTTRATSTPKRPLETILAEYIAKAGNPPAVMNLPYGHIRGKISAPIGLRVRLDADRQQLLLLEPFVE
jgi:muramoyltetrapeptide carboxypeptidase